jgi:hypothetical protein
VCCKTIYNYQDEFLPADDITHGYVAWICASAARHLKTGKRRKGNRKGKRGREPTIVIVFFHRTTIDGESSQKLNKISKTFSSRCGVYLRVSRKDKSIFLSEVKDKTFSSMWKKTKAFNKSSPFSLHFCRC